VTYRGPTKVRNTGKNKGAQKNLVTRNKKALRPAQAHKENCRGKSGTKGETGSDGKLYNKRQTTKRGWCLNGSSRCHWGVASFYK